jgi:hypothetical protein
VEQLLLCAKSPLAVALDMLRLVVPVLVTVKLWERLVVPSAWLPNMTLGWLTTAPVAVPFPLNDTVPRPALVVTVSVPVRAPVVLGVKDTFIVQVPLAATVTQLSVSLKSPLTLTALMESELVPLFVSDTLCDALAVETP